MQRLRELFDYSPETGLFTYKVAPARKPSFVGAVAGTNHGAGYKVIKINQRVYLCHRLAWLYVYGFWPSMAIDHINGVRSDNRLSNLRDVSPGVNLQNQRKPRSNNKSGFLGVRPHRERFSAQIVLDGRPQHLGTFDTPEEAHEVYLAAKRKHHPGCAI